GTRQRQHPCPGLVKSSRPRQGIGKGQGVAGGIKSAIASTDAERDRHAGRKPGSHLECSAAEIECRDPGALNQTSCPGENQQAAVEIVRSRSIGRLGKNKAAGYRMGSARLREAANGVPTAL